MSGYRDSTKGGHKQYLNTFSLVTPSTLMRNKGLSEYVAISAKVALLTGKTTLDVMIVSTAHLYIRSAQLSESGMNPVGHNVLEGDYLYSMHIVLGFHHHLQAFVHRLSPGFPNLAMTQLPLSTSDWLKRYQLPSRQRLSSIVLLISTPHLLVDQWIGSIG